MMQRPFNIYAVGKELYNIPDDRLREFLTDFPQAVKLSPEQVKTGIQPRVPSAGAVTGKPGVLGDVPDAENRLSQQDVQKIQEKRNRTALLRNEPLGLSGEVHIFDRILGRPFNRPYTSDGIPGPKLDKISRQVPAGSAAMEQAIRNNYKREAEEYHSPEQQALRELDRINEDIDKAMTSPEIRRGMSGNAITRLGGRYSSMLNMYGNDTDMQAENDYNNLKTARTKINEARNTIRAAQGKKGFWKGLSDELFSEKALSLGLNEIEDGGRLQVLLDKAEKEGLDALTPSEKTLLDAVSIKSVTDMLHADNIPFWYHVGSGVGASIPYMMQFAVTKIPASAATKPLTRYITRRFLTGAAQKAAGRGVRHAAANFGRRALAGTANTALIGTAMAPLQPTTYSDILQRHMGQTHATLDENGKVKYLGQENRKSVGRSIAEGLGASTISNVAEMSGALLGTVGKFLKPGTRKVISATTRHISPRLTGFISRTTPRALDYTKMIKDKNIITGFRDFAKTTGWNGIAGETFEEFMEGTLNAVTIGDQGLEDIYNWENALQTITTVGIMSVGMSSAAATLRAGAKRKIKADYDRADRHLDETFPPHRVAEIKSILGENLEDQSKILGQMFAESSKATTPEERKQRSQEQAIIQDYIYKANLYEAYLGGLQSRIKEEAGRIIENLRRQANPDMGATIYADYRGQTVRITSGTFDIDPEGNITPREGSTGMLTIITPEGDTQVVSPSQLGKVQDYMTLDEQASTVEQQVEDAVLSQEESEMNTLAPGTVVSVNKNGSPLRVIVTSQNADTVTGRIVAPYGKPVTGPDGQEQTLSFTLDEIQSYPEEESGAGAPEIVLPVEEKISDATVQDNYVYKGNEAEKVLLDIFDKGTDEVLPGRIETVSEFEREFSSPVRTVLGEVVKVGRNLYNKLVRNSRENISGAIRSTLEAADFVINDTDGSRLYVKMYKKSDGKKTYNVTVVNKQGEVEDYISSAHIKSENNLLNKIRNGAELSLPSERNPYGRNLPNSPAPISLDKDRGIIENRQAIEERISADSHIEPENIPALQRIPKDAQGIPLYEQADPDTAWDAIVEQAGGDEQVAQNVAASMLADKEAALKKQAQSQPKGGTTIAEKIVAERERKAAIEQAKQQVDIWKKIAQTPQKRKQQAETERIRQAEEEKIKSDGAGRTESDSEQDGNGTQETFSQGTSAEDIRQVQRGRGLGNGLNEEDSTAFMSLMEANAVQSPQIELNPTNWVEQFGEDGKVTTPIGIVKMGNNQIEKLFEKGRSQQFGMIKPTLEQPLAVIEVPSTTDNGTEERESSYLFVKTFLGKNGEKVYYFKSVTVKKDGLEVSVSSHYDRPARIKDALKKGKLLYRFDGGAQTEQRPADVSVTASPKRLQGILEDKNTKKSLNGKESDEKVAPVEAEIKPIGRGVFGNIYDQFKGKAKAAIDFLSRLHDGEAIGALHHKDVGDISLVWGNEKAGLQKIIKKHPEVLGNIQDIIDGMHIVQTSENRIKLESDSHFAVISRDWKGEAHTPWLLTAYEKKENSAINNTMDTVDTSKGEQNDTATPQGTVSDDKSTKNPLKANELGEKIAAVEAKTDTNRASGRGGSRDSRGSGEISATAAIEGSGKKELTKEEAAAFIAFMEEHAEVAPEMELTIENWDAEFGENGIVQTPVGKVKMGENQFTKLMRQGRSGKLGMIKPTLENPDVIIEDESKATEGDITERYSSYVFVRTFKKSDGSRYYYFTSVTVSQGNMEVVVSNQEKTKKRISNLLQRNAISWINEKVQSASEAQNGKSVSLDDSWTATQADNNTAPLGINSSELSESKGSEKTPITSESGEKVAPSETETDTTPNETQAGNGQAPFLSESEYIDRALQEAFDASGITSREEWEDSEAYIDAYNRASDSYPDYILGLQSSGRLQEMYDRASIGERISIREGIETAGYKVKDILDTEKEKQEARKKRDAARRKRSEELMAKLGIVLDKANEADSLLGENGEPADGELARKVAQAEAETDTNPTDKQKEAGNYKKGHVRVDGLDITIEQPKGSVRSGVDANGNKWETEMHNTYGYIRGTEGVDGDHIDVFLSDTPQEGDVFVVDQVNKDGTFDEHKVMYGFPSEQAAREAYLSNYEEGWQGLGAITQVSKEEFRKWLGSSHRKTKPFAEYKSVKFEKGNEKSSMTETQQEAYDVVRGMLEDAGIPVEVLTNEQMNTLSGSGEVRLMGSRVDKRMAEIGKHFEGKELDDNTRAVVDVFSGKTDNKVIEVGRPEGTQHVVMRQGTENKAGTKHSLFRHFGTRNNHITPEDIVRIPEVIAKGERIVDGKKVSYSYTTEDGTLLRVTTEIRNRRETFTNFMSNRKSPTSELVEHATSAQASDERESDVKVGKKSESTNGIGEKPRLMTVYHGSGAEFDTFDHSHMGEGEGAQAYGWGSYVTEVEGIGRTYAETSGGRDIRLRINRLAQHVASRKEFIKTRKSDIRKNEDYDKYARSIQKNLHNSQKEYKAAERAGDKREMEFYQSLINISEQQLERGHHKHLIDSFWEDINNAQADIDKSNAEITDLKEELKKKSRHLYTVEIPDDTGENYLKWEEKPDRGVVRKIAKSLRDNGYHVTTLSNKLAEHSEEGALWGEYDVSDGEGLYRAIERILSGDRAASEFLSSIGFTGISYPAEATTGGRADGARNYVIFNEKDLKITNHISFLKDNKGIIYGATVGGKIYLNGSSLNPETPIHEYTHLWDTACQNINPELWLRGVELMKQTPLWEQVQNDPAYADLTTDDEIAGEVHSRLTGKDGAKLLEDIVSRSRDGNAIEVAKAVTVRERLRNWLKDFWWWLKDTLSPWTKAEAERVTIEDFVHMPLKDLVRGTNLTGSRMTSEESRIVERAKADGTFMNTGEYSPADNDIRFHIDTTIQAEGQQERSHDSGRNPISTLQSPAGSYTPGLSSTGTDHVLGTGLDLGELDTLLYGPVPPGNLPPWERVAYAQKLKKELGSDITLYGWPDEVPADITRELPDIHKVQGFYDPKSGRMGIILHHTPDKRTIARVMMHEIVGHRGIRGLLGEQSYRFYEEVYTSMPASLRESYTRRYGSRQVAADEYIADLAGRMYRENPFRQLWEELVALFRGSLRALGIKVKLNESDIRFILREARRQSRSGNLRYVHTSPGAVRSSGAPHRDEPGKSGTPRPGGTVPPSAEEPYHAVLSMLERAGIPVEILTEEEMEQLAKRGDAVLQARMNALEKAVRTIRGWRKNNVRGKSFTIDLPQRVKDEIRRVMGRDIDSHNITSDSLRHILRGHGESGSKLTDGSIPLRESDLELIPYIMTAPDKVEKSSTDLSGRESVRFYKDLSNGYVVVVEKEYKDSPNDMETITMWAEKSSAATNARSQKNAPDTLVRNAIRSTDIAKIQKDAEAAISGEEKLLYDRDGIIYGATAGGKIYLNGSTLNPETPIHEYTHLWDAACQNINPELWRRGVELMKQAPLWEQVKADPAYADLTTDNEIAGEVHSRLTGKDGARLLEDIVSRSRDGNAIEVAKAVTLRERLKNWLKDYWWWLRDTLSPWTRAEAERVTIEDFVHMPLKDLVRGTDLTGSRMTTEESRIVERAKADGTFMKAPNGKPTNLSERQWVQVRTRAFKERFGDWEKAAKVLNVVPAAKDHGFKNFAEAKEWAKANIVRMLTNSETGGKGEIRISNNAVDKYLSNSAVAKSESKDVHLAVLKVLPDTIRESIDAEQHANYKKSKDGKRSPNNGANEDVIVHRLYGAVDIDGQIYRVKVTLKEYTDENRPKKAYTYEATKIELLAGTLVGIQDSNPSTNNSITVANLLKGVEKSYGNGEKLLDDFTKVTDENGEPLTELADKTSIQMMFIGEQGAGRMDKVEESRIGKVNSQFNEELQQQIDGTLPKGHVYRLGMPSAVLQSAGLPHLPIELASSRLAAKSMQENHPFDLSELEGLSLGLQKPLAVFRSATRIGSYVVMTEIQHKGKNFVVAIQANRKQGRIEVNSVRSVHYRNSNVHIANWIEDGLLEYADKKRMAEWFSKQRYNSADVRKLFNHSAKIVENFENPKTGNENLCQDTGSDTGQGAENIPRYHIEAERSEKAGRNVISSNQASSGADTPGLSATGAPYRDEPGKSGAPRPDGGVPSVTEEAYQAVVSMLERAGISVEILTGEEMQQLAKRGDAVLQARMNALEKAVRTIRGWRKNNVRGKSFTIDLPQRVKDEIRRVMGRDIDSHNITSDSLRHILKGHGVSGEKLDKNSIPLSEADLELIPYIMTAPDRVERGSTDASGRESIRFKKSLSNGYVVVLEKEQKDSPDDMDTITMWAELSSSNVSDARTKIRPLNSTSQPANVANGSNAADGTNARTVIISSDDITKIQKDAEAAISGEEKLLYDRDGIIYGATAGGKIYLNGSTLNPETPIHEYTHLWDAACQNINPELWRRGVELMKQAPLWEQVKADPAYADLTTDNEIAGEVHSRLTGKDGARLLEDIVSRSRDGNAIEVAKAVTLRERLKNWLKDYWWWLRDTLSPWTRAEAERVTIEDFVHMPLKDLVRGTDLTGSRMTTEESRIVERAKADGTFMKAPNGKPTNLSERQWVQVRTRAFKERFGDWELGRKVLEIVQGVREHGFKGFDAAKKWAKENITRTYSDDETGGKGEIRISNRAIDKYLSQSAIDKSESKDVHLSVLRVLPDVLRASIDAERHPDYIKKDGKRNPENGINPDVTIHVLYGSVNIDGQIYRVKVTLKEYTDENRPKKAYTYEATKIELLAGTLVGIQDSNPSTNNSITVANLLKGVEKSYGNGEKLLDDFTKVTDENGEPLTELADKTSIQMMFIGEQGAGRMDKVEESRIGKVNSQFNEELQQQIDGTLPKGHVYRLGMPSAVLQSAGLPHLPIELASSRLAAKSMQENHPFDLSELEGLSLGLQKPLAVFRSATRMGSYVVMTEIQHKGKNFVVAIQTNKKKGKIEINDIRSVHYRNSNAHMANWIDEGLLEYADKKSMVEWFSKQRYNSAEVRKLFNHASKIVKNFENPKTGNENLRQDTGSDTGQGAENIPRNHIEKERDEEAGRNPISTLQSPAGADTPGSSSTGTDHVLGTGLDLGELDTLLYGPVPPGNLPPWERVAYAQKLKKELGSDITLYGWPDEVPADITRELPDIHKVQGFYDPKSGRMGIILHHTPDKRTIARVMMHEIVGHRGIRGLLGEQSYRFYEEVYASMPASLRERYTRRYGSRQVAADEYIADLAGKMYRENPFRQLWEELVALFRGSLRALGIKVKLNESDIRFILREARRQSRSGSLRYVHTSPGAVRSAGAPHRDEPGKSGAPRPGGGVPSVTEEAYHAVVSMLERAGISVEILTGEEMQQLAKRGDVTLLGKKKAPETVLPEDESSFKGTVVSDAETSSGTATMQRTAKGFGNKATVIPDDVRAKILKNLETAKDVYSKRNNNTKGFITDIARALGLRRHESSHYGTLEASNGMKFTLRISNHNASVSNFDSHKEAEGISIVISNYKNKGLNNNGKGHVVEFFYPRQNINKSDGKPLVEILESLKDTLYSGEYKDTTRLSQRQEVNELPPKLQADGDNIIYGATAGGKLYLNGSALNPETPLHEYTHLWDTACQNINPELWLRGVELMKQTPLWEQVQNDPAYADLTTDDEIAGEVHSRLTGKDGAKLLEDIVSRSRDGNAIEVAKAVTVRERLRNWLKDFWWWLKDTLSPWTKAEAERVTIEDFVHMPLKDLVRGTDLTGSRMTTEESRIVERAKADGTFMKAPNGKPTNLSERQWVQVRTRAFKERFGDWEKAAKVLNVVPAAKDHGFKNFAEAKEWAKANIVRTFTNEETYVR